jgi:hypothetical protein
MNAQEGAGGRGYGLMKARERRDTGQSNTYDGRGLWPSRMTMYNAFLRLASLWT